MLKKAASAALIALAFASIATAPVQAAPASAESARMAGFTLLGEAKGFGRTVRLWRNDGNDLYHAQLLNGVKGDQLSVSACHRTPTGSTRCVADTKYGNGEPDLNTSEMWGPHDQYATLFIVGVGSVVANN